MKSFLLKLSFISAFLLLIISPKLSIDSARNGLILWAKTIVPTLFPAMILCGLLIEINAAALTARIAYPVTRRILGISLEGTYCFMMGIMCGYPLGSKTIADMLRSKRISYLQAKSLFAICAYPSPMFLIGYIHTETLHNEIPLWGLLLCIYAPCILLKTISDMIAFFGENRDHNLFPLENDKRGAFKMIVRNLPVLAHKFKWNQTRLIRFETIDDLVLNSALMMLKIGGYMMLFSILASWAVTYIKIAPILALLLGGCCEMTIGVNQLLHYYSIRKALPILCFFLSFGGLSTVAQTNCVIRDTNLKISHYISYKLLHGLFSGGMMWLLLRFHIL